MEFRKDFDYKLPPWQPKKVNGWNSRIRHCKKHIENNKKVLKSGGLTKLQRRNIAECVKRSERYLQLLISERDKFIDPLPSQYLTN